MQTQTKKPAAKREGKSKSTRTDSPSFQQWLRSMPQTQDGFAKATIEIELCLNDWSQLLMIVDAKGWTIDQAVNEVLADDELAPINNYLLHMDGEQKSEAE